MKGEIFIDSNILIYAVSQNSPKCEIARKLLIENIDQITVSSQVINKKSEVKSAMHIKKRYKYSYWDSLIIASALENDYFIYRGFTAWADY